MEEANPFCEIVEDKTINIKIHHSVEIKERMEEIHEKIKFYNGIKEKIGKKIKNLNFPVLVFSYFIPLILSFIILSDKTLIIDIIAGVSTYVLSFIEVFRNSMKYEKEYEKATLILSLYSRLDRNIKKELCEWGKNEERKKFIHDKIISEIDFIERICEFSNL